MFEGRLGPEPVALKRLAEGLNVLSRGAGEPWEGGEQGRGRGSNEDGRARGRLGQGSWQGRTRPEWPCWLQERGGEGAADSGGRRGRALWAEEIDVCRDRGGGGRVHCPVGMDLAPRVEEDSLTEDGGPRRRGKGSGASEGPSLETRLFKGGLFSLPVTETPMT